LQQYNLKPFDRLHVALSEACFVDVFLTTDDRLLNAINRIDLKVKVANPIFWFMEVTAHEQQRGN